MSKAYPVITLCGSTRFRKEYELKQKELTLQGNIVISVGLFGHDGDSEVWENMDEGERKLCRDLVHSCEYRKDANDFQIIRGMFDLYFTGICSLEYWYMETSKPQFDVKEIPVDFYNNNPKMIINAYNFKFMLNYLYNR